MNLQISGRTAVISGAAGAIACETARILLEEGCRVILSDIDVDALQQSVNRLGGTDNIRCVVSDLSDRDGADRLQRDGVRRERQWQPDILLHAAGVTGANYRIDGGSVQTLDV